MGILCRDGLESGVLGMIDWPYNVGLLYTFCTAWCRTLEATENQAAPVVIQTICIKDTRPKIEEVRVNDHESRNTISFLRPFVM
jgi:hypothetical protein